MSGRPAVSVVIPSIGSTGTVFGTRRCFVVEAVRSVLATARVPLEIIVVAGREMPTAVIDRLFALPGAARSPDEASAAADADGLGVRDGLRAHATSTGAAETDAAHQAVVGDVWYPQATPPAALVRIVEYDADFNFSAAVNLGAAHACGDQLLLLNDDVEVISPDWLLRMLDAAANDGVGAVGAKLLFEDGTLQHAGHTYRTSLDHVGFGLPGDAPGRDGILTRRRPVAGVTAACMLVPFHVYDLVGGLCTELPGNYNDVDLCMKIRTAGFAIVYEPAAVLHHFESQSRTVGIRPEEVELIQSRWLGHLVDDSFTPAFV